MHSSSSSSSSDSSSDVAFIDNLHQEELAVELGSVGVSVGWCRWFSTAYAVVHMVVHCLIVFTTAVGTFKGLHVVLIIEGCM
jgi:hypothetical protein